MEVHVFILSCQSPKMATAFFRNSSVDIDVRDDIQRFEWHRPNRHDRKVSVWTACHSPLTTDLLPLIVPYMDAVVCLYHDHDALSCLKMRSAMSSLSPYHGVIYPMMTAIPRLHRRHASRIKKFYNKDGFEREMLTGTLAEMIEKILKLDLNITKTLDRLV